LIASAAWLDNGPRTTTDCAVCGALALMAGFAPLAMHVLSRPGRDRRAADDAVRLRRCRTRRTPRPRARAPRRRAAREPAIAWTAAAVALALSRHQSHFLQPLELGPDRLGDLTSRPCRLRGSAPASAARNVGRGASHISRRTFYTWRLGKIEESLIAFT
jgi:hypothetical protein